VLLVLWTYGRWAEWPGKQAADCTHYGRTTVWSSPPLPSGDSLKSNYQSAATDATQFYNAAWLLNNGQCLPLSYSVPASQLPYITVKNYNYNTIYLLAWSIKNVAGSCKGNATIQHVVGYLLKHLSILSIITRI